MPNSVLKNQPKRPQKPRPIKWVSPGLDAAMASGISQFLPGHPCAACPKVSPLWWCHCSPPALAVVRTDLPCTWNSELHDICRVYVCKWFQKKKYVGHMYPPGIKSELLENPPDSSWIFPLNPRLVRDFPLPHYQMVTEVVLGSYSPPVYPIVGYVNELHDQAERSLPEQQAQPFCSPTMPSASSNFKTCRDGKIRGYSLDEWRHLLQMYGISRIDTPTTRVVYHLNGVTNTEPPKNGPTPCEQWDCMHTAYQITAHCT